MGDLHQLPDVREVEREASEWIARLHADDVSAEDRMRFEAWRNAHPARAEAYESMMFTWRQFAAAGPFVRAVSFAQSVSEPAVAYPQRRRLWGALAASLLMTALAGLLYFALQPSGSSFATAVGEQLAISLPDGSTVQLNSNSIAHVSYDARSRVIRLEQGEAYFKVAKDTQRPFWVVSGKTWVRAVGTAFNVHLRASGVQVTVDEGTVKVGYAQSMRNIATPSEELAGSVASVLTAGHQAQVAGAHTSTRGLSVDELEHSMSWREGTLYFEGRTLGEVIDELGRYTNRELVVNDEQLRQMVIGGTFQANPQGAEALLAMLEQGFGLSVRNVGDRAYIESRPD